jgi:hypothetical protein
LAFTAILPAGTGRLAVELRKTRSDASALNEMDNHHDDGDDQDEMYEAAPDVESKETKGPKHQQDETDHQ